MLENTLDNLRGIAPCTPLAAGTGFISGGRGAEDDFISRSAVEVGARS
jgi:hypothetical protein